MPAWPLIDSALIRLFRFRTRGFLKMEDAAGQVPPPPSNGEAYLYVHIPFCAALCPFCSFHRVQHCHAHAVPYFTALRDELRLYHAAGYKFTGVYFGGGTPTIEPEELRQTIALVRELFAVREISVETNPHELQPPMLALLREAGVTRLSVGVQSFDNRLLRDMERYEKYGSAEEIIERLKSAVGLFPTLNVDLIFNQPHQSLASLERDLDLIREIGVTQVSCYPLMTAPSVKRRMTTAMGDTDNARLRPFFETILRRLQPDFTPTSAWCFTKKGTAGDEYIVTAENYVGVGSGAFSYLDGILYATTFSLSHYAAQVARGLTGITARHQLSASDQIRYALLVRMFGLGLDREWARARYGSRFFRTVWGELATLNLLGAARRTERGWQLTERGMYWLMLMMSEFFGSVNTYRDAMRQRVSGELEADLTQPPLGHSLLAAAIPGSNSRALVAKPCGEARAVI
jgi:coproporphyrinogen III oxidase-like Fe-S oxidoreductase